MTATAMLLATVAVTAFSGLMRPVDAIPMAWRIDRGSAAGEPAICAVVSLGGDVNALLRKGEPGDALAWSVAIGAGSEPNSVHYLRIGRQIFQTSGEEFGAADSRRIVEALKSPGEVAFEWFQRPGFIKRQGLFATGDFAARAAKCERWMTGTPV